MERLNEIKKEAYAENLSCLSHWEPRNLPRPPSCGQDDQTLSGVYLIGNPEICQDPPSCGQDDQTLLMWILMWKKGKNLVCLYVKLSILSIGGPRLIFMNSNKCPTMWLIKK